MSESMLELGKQEAPTISGTPFIRFGEVLGSGITGVAERVLYMPMKDRYPVGLGEWVMQRSDLAADFPPTPREWVEEPKLVGFVVLKLPRQTGDTQIYGQLSAERAALLQLQKSFVEGAVARPPRLFGYGFRKHTGDPYLILEDITKLGNFHRLDYYLTQEGSLPEQKALEIATRLAFILTKAHANGIVHNDLRDDKLDNIFWNPIKKEVRLIDWANASRPAAEQRLGLMGAGTFGRDRNGLARVLFRLITGRACPEQPYGNITGQDWRQMSQPTRDIIAEALYLRPKSAPDPSAIKDISEYTDKMLSDLTKAA